MFNKKEYIISYYGRAYVFANSKEEAEELFEQECYHSKKEEVFEIEETE